MAVCDLSSYWAMSKPHSDCSVILLICVSKPFGYLYVGSREVMYLNLYLCVELSEINCSVINTISIVYLHLPELDDQLCQWHKGRE